MLRLFTYTAFTVSACVAAMAFLISGGPLDASEVAAIKARLGRAYVIALSHAERAARDARAEYCERHAGRDDPCAPPP